MASLEQPKSIEEKQEFQTPFCNVTLKEFTEAHPEKREAMRTVLKDIDAQAMDNFEIFNSERFPGVSFSFSKLTVSSEIIERLAAQKNTGTPPDQKDENAEIEEGKEEGVGAKRHDYFLFTAFAPPPDGHALTVQDVAIDRYIRLIPRVANALKLGEKPPEVNVYLLGAPTGLGGSVTEEWIEEIKENGLEKYGEMYAEFVEQHEAEHAEPHVVLQGVSKGAIIAERTSKYLPEELQEKTQRLLDNPAGHHEQTPVIRWLKGAQVALGLAGEGVARMVFDDSMKSLMKQGGALTENLKKTKGIPDDEAVQTKLKQSAALAEGLALMKGSPLDTESTRSFIRRAIYDPLTISPTWLHEVWKKSSEGKKAQFFKKGRSVESSFKGHHMLFYNRYHRWSTILDFAQNSQRVNTPET